LPEKNKKWSGAPVVMEEATCAVRWVLDGSLLNARWYGDYR